MRQGDAIIIIIFVIIFIVSGLRRLSQSAAEANKARGAQGGAARGGAEQGPDAEASPSEVEDFLRSLQQTRRQQGQVQAPPRRPQGAQRQAGRVQAGRQEAPFWQGQPPQPINEEGPTTRLVQAEAPVRPAGRQEGSYWQGQPPQPINEEGPTTRLVQAEAPARQAAPAVRPTRARRRRKDDDDTVETLVAKEPVKETSPTVAKPAAAALPDLKKFSLRDAVIWSEILRPPLSLRRRGGHGGSPFSR